MKKLQKIRRKRHDFLQCKPINWGQIVTSNVYYFSAYCDLLKAGTIKEEGDKINVVVPKQLW